MARPLVEALRVRPLLFEPVPPPARAPPAVIGSRVAAVREELGPVSRLDAVNVPELVDENHDGRPFYRTVDPRTYARSVVDGTSLTPVVNRIVAHGTPAALVAWAERGVAEGTRHVVLVGGSSRYVPYPGPTVTEANRLVDGVLAPAGGLVGNVAIPQRAGEAQRMLGKTRAGAAFFTTQLVFDPTSVVRLVREYAHWCRRANVVPATVLVSVAPLADEADLDFARWLGAEIPESAERAILAGAEEEAVARSVERAVGVWSALAATADAEALDVPLGVNVEQVSVRHLADAARLLRRFARVIDEPPAATTPPIPSA